MQLSLELLRSFVTIVDQDGFGRAGQLLGRSQPAMSLQIKRLEMQTGTQLLMRNSRRIQVTEQGQLVMQYARRILAQHDELVNRIQSQALSGVVRLGIPNEFAMSHLPQVLASFSARYPEVRLEVVSELSRDLRAHQQTEGLDLIISINTLPDQGAPDAARFMWMEELVWVESDAARTRRSQVPHDTPLIVAPEGCVYREQMLRALDARSLSWNIVYTGTSYGGIRAAVMAGLGVTAMARSTVPDGLRVVRNVRRLPDLETVPVSLQFLSSAPSPVVTRLADYILESVGARMRADRPGTGR